MATFHETPNGLVAVRNAGSVYLDTRENFVADFGQGLEPLPAGADERLYEPGVRHAILDRTGVIAGGDRTWAFGDAAIAALSALLAAKTAREQANEPEPPPPPDPGTVPPRLRAAAFEVEVANFDIAAMNGVFNLVSAAYLDVGQYMLFFLNPMEGTDYWVEFGGGAPYMTVQLKDPTCVIIQAQDAVGGAFVDPASFSVKIYRID